MGCTVRWRRRIRRRRQLFDGIDSSSFLRSDATDSATGALTFANSVTINGAQTGNYANLGIYNSTYNNRYIYMGTSSDTDQCYIRAYPNQYSYNRYVSMGIAGLTLSRLNTMELKQSLPVSHLYTTRYKTHTLSYKARYIMAVLFLAISEKLLTQAYRS